MSVELKMRINEFTKEAVHTFDETGVFSTTNETGWGVPNEVTSDMTSATLTFFPPETSVTTVIDVFPSFPNDAGVGFEVTAEDLGMTELTSGVWKVEYNVKGANNFDQTISCYVFFRKSIECCIAHKAKCIDPCNLDEDSEFTLNMRSLLERANRLGNQGDLVGAQEIATLLNKQCQCCFI